MKKSLNWISWLIPHHCVISVELSSDPKCIKPALVALRLLLSRWEFNLFSLIPCICMQCVCLNNET